MKSLLPLAAFLLASALSAVAAEKIESFLGVKFGATRDAAKEAMVARGFKPKDNKATDILIFKDGTFSGQPVTEVKLQFAADKFTGATVGFEIHNGKREECARLGLDAYEQVRGALTEKYGPPASTTSVPRAKILDGKPPANTALKTVWRTPGGLPGENRTITFSTTTISLYAWAFNVTYAGPVPAAAPNQVPARNDL